MKPGGGLVAEQISRHAFENDRKETDRGSQSMTRDLRRASTEVSLLIEFKKSETMPVRKKE